MKGVKLSYKTGGFALASKGASGAGDDWTIAGYASTFGNLDLAGDIVLQGAFAQTIREHPEVPLMWQHQYDEPIGKVFLLKEDEYGLLFKAKISPTRRGQDVRQLVKDGAVNSLSIGYKTELSRPVEMSGGKYAHGLEKLTLYEISVVSFPANPLAVLTSSSRELLSAMQDNLIVAECEAKQAAGQWLSRAEQIRYLNAASRQIERARSGGKVKTRAQVLHEVELELVELELQELNG